MLSTPVQIEQVQCQLGGYSVYVRQRSKLALALSLESSLCNQEVPDVVSGQRRR